MGMSGHVHSIGGGGSGGGGAGDVSGPAGATADDIVLFSGATGKVIKDSGLTIAQVVASVPNRGFVQYSEVKLNGANLSTISNAFVDVPGLSIAMTTGAHRCIVNLVSVAGLKSYGDVVSFDISIDGVLQGGPFGLSWFESIDDTGAITTALPVNLSYYTSVLSAAAHTFKVQWFVSGGTGLLLTANSPAIFSVTETGLT